MKALIGLSALLTVIAASIVFAERRAVSQLRSDNATLRQETEGAATLVVDQAELVDLRKRVATNQTPDLSDLPRLRNQVHQLREQAPAVEKLRADVDKLAAELAAPLPAPDRLADLPGFVPKEKWRDAGLVRPEDALQTFFAAISAGNVDRVIQCLEPKEAEQWQGAIAKDPDQGNASIRWWQKTLQASGYRIVDRKDNQRDEVVRLEVQAAGNGVVMGMDFKRYGGEWKVEAPFQPVNNE